MSTTVPATSPATTSHGQHGDDMKKTARAGGGWVVLKTRTVINGQASTSWLVTTPRGSEPAFHPTLDAPVTAWAVALLLNELGWSEDDYLDAPHSVTAAVEHGQLRRFLRKNRRARR